eukprot:4914035-Amphidinium_carterae.2
MGRGSSHASSAAWMRFRAASTSKAVSPSSAPGLSSGFGGAPLTSAISCPGVSTTTASALGSCARRSATRPCSGAGGLPLPGLGVLGRSLCPVAWTRVSSPLLSLDGGTGAPGASIVAEALRSWSTLSASALACGSPYCLAHSSNSSKAEEDAKQ